MGDESYFRVIRRLAEYEVWCNSRIIEAADALETEQLFRPFSFGFNTIHATLFHTVEVFQMWSGCVAPAIAKAPLRPYDASLSVERIAAWNAELSHDFMKALDASHAAGLLHADRRVEQAFHLVTHGTHHRSQILAMLRLLGKDPPYEGGDFGGWSRGS